MTGPSLRELDGQINNSKLNKEVNTVNKNYYLKNIRNELIEEGPYSERKNNNQIIFINAELQGVAMEVMIDTGANVSLSDKVEFNRIKAMCKEPIPTLPVNNMVIVGATGRLNKSVRHQVQIEVSSKGKVIPVVFWWPKGYHLEF